jgi:PTS system galactitol-specific IIA component
MGYKELFQHELIEIDATYLSQKEMFEVVSKKLYKKGYVKATFRDALIKREAEYPTGLALNKTSIAIPHTDVHHIEIPFIYVIKLKRPLSFVQMATTEEWIEVDYIFMLGIKDPSKQVGLLSIIMNKMQEDQFANKFSGISSVNEMEAFLKYEFGSGEE